MENKMVSIPFEEGPLTISAINADVDCSMMIPFYIHSVG